MASTVKRKRIYRSERRQEQAQVTRERILDAAFRRFARDGYVATTMAAISREAGVATPTVYAVFTTKVAILRELVARAIFGADAPWVPAAERGWYQDLVRLADPVAILRHHVAHVIEVNRRVAPLQRIAEGAGEADPEIAALWRRAVAQRMHGQRTVAELLAARRGLASGLTTRRASEIIWAMTDARLYQALVLSRHWSQAAFEDWLFNTLCACLLAEVAIQVNSS